MAKTGYLIVVYQDVNPSSPTYNQTREERTQSEEFCPSSAPANWIEDTKYCELTENGMLTGYEITVYRDVEPLSSTYNQTREERELNTTECEADDSNSDWQNIGDPFCRQIAYMPSGLLGNDGYMVQQQQDMNEYSETGGQIRDIATLDLEHCPLPDTQPSYTIIHESCHIVQYNGELVFDGTKDVTRIDSNPYSPTWNDNIPETVNVPDEINCPSELPTRYRWVTISGEYVCVGFDKYALQKKQITTDGGETWADVSPMETRTGSLLETNSEYCGYTPPPTPQTQYRWVEVSGSTECVGYDKYKTEKKQQSTDNGQTWTDVVPSETRAGELIEANSADCGYIEARYRWVTIDDEFVCVGYDKYTLQKKQISTDNGSTWTDVSPLETQTGELVESNSEYCGYVPSQTIYRWVTVSGSYECVGYDKYTLQKRQVSNDGGTTWTDVSPLETMAGVLIEANSEDCGYISAQYRWVTISGQHICVGNDKYSVEKKQQSTDGGTTWTDVSPLETKTGSLIQADSADCGYVPPVVDYSTQYLTIETLTDGDISFETSVIGSYDPAYISYSGDNGVTWHRIQAQYNTINIGNVPAGEKILFKGNNSRYATVYQSGYRYCFLRTTGRAKVYGNIMSLIYGDNFVGETTLTEGLTFYRFFSGNYVDAQNLILPATTLTHSCYKQMFYCCGLLVNSPALPATTLARECYNQMFRSCTSLTSAPALPATTMTNYCYAGMFYDCTSLTTAPELPATTLADYCYNYMFYGCTNLNYIKAMFTTTPSTNYTDCWVSGVAASGTFVKNNVATWNVIGIHGVPSGWVVRYEGAQYRWVTVSGSYECVGYDKYTLQKEQISRDGGTTWTDTGETRTGTLIEENSADCGYIPPVNPYARQYLTFEVVDGGTITIKASNANVVKTISYSTDNGNTWTSLTTSTTAQELGGILNVGDKILVKGNNSSYATSLSYYNYFGGTAKVNVYGNIMSLVDGDYFLGSYTLTDTNVFNSLFYAYYNLLSAENLVLPATTLASYCYTGMFYDCTSLTTAPSTLPATTLANGCYTYMFMGCTSLTTAPTLPATTLADSCYHQMFQGTSLTTAPALPATTLANGCYSNMFYGCTSLTTAPELPATTLASYCYDEMFSGCTNLNYIKCLATDISAEGCTSFWVSRVAASGTFVKDSSMTSWRTGDSGIPSGWTIQNQ